MQQSDNVQIAHMILLSICVVAVTILAAYDIRQGGDGMALATGIAAITAVGGVITGKLLP